jgi:hypothetical protein
MLRYSCTEIKPKETKGLHPEIAGRAEAMLPDYILLDEPRNI